MTTRHPLDEGTLISEAGGKVIFSENLGTSPRPRLRLALFPLEASPHGEGTTPQKKGSVLILNGRTEFIGKYANIAQQFKERGFEVLTFDWRGQGLSERKFANAGGYDRGHIDNFSEYQEDLQHSLQAAGWLEPWTTASQNKGGLKLLVTHSMGGSIGLRALLDGTIKPDAALFLAPMFGINFSLPTWVCRVCAEIMTRLGGGPHYALGQRHWQPPESAGPYTLKTSKPLTSDPDLFDLQHRLIDGDRKLRLGGVTWGWLAAAIQEMTALTTHKHLSELKLPIFCGLGCADRVVKNSTTKRLMQSLRHGQLVMLKDSGHEPLFETASIRSSLWNQIDVFITKLTPKETRP